MTCGIYCYKDTQNNNKIVYVGKDSRINKNRRKYNHLQPSKYDAQPFNRILQDNPDRYTYHVLKEGDFSKGLLKALEVIYIHRYSPKFNFTKGGDGSTGYKHTEEAKRKISEAHKGKSLPMKTRINMSKANSTTGYFRVSKRWNKKYLNGFIWIYSYEQDGKRKTIQSVDIRELEKKVRLKGLRWIKFE